MLEMKYGNFILHGNGRNKLTAIDGIGVCPVPSYQNDEYADADGVSERSKKDSARTITVSGDFFDNKSRDECKRLNRAAYKKDYLYILSDSVRVKIYCKLTKLSISHKGADIFSYTLQLSADYPYFKSYADKTVNVWGDTDNVITVFTLPCVFTSRHSRTALYNNGDKKVFPVIEITAIGTPSAESNTVTVTNHTTGAVLKLEKVLTDGETITIDLPRRRIESSADGIITHLITDDTNLSECFLAAGENDIEGSVTEQNQVVSIIAMYNTEYISAEVY